MKKSAYLCATAFVVTLMGGDALALPPCWESAEPVCTDGPRTRIINGEEITRACWNYRHEFTCGIRPPVDNCAAVRATVGCVVAESTCASSDQNGNCTLNTYTFRCTSAGSPTTQTVCGSDVYCSTGDCVGSSVEAPSTFAHGYGMMAAAAAAAGSLNTATGLMLPGYGEWCRQQLNGARDCCNFDGILNGLLSCDRGEEDLATANQDRRIHYVGRFCSLRGPFNVCLENKSGYCIFQSMLSRIIHEQGRPQLGIGWGSAQAPNCQGLTMDQFVAIDFSRVDFSEYIATVTVPPPNEAAAIGAVQGSAQSQTTP